MSGPKDYVIAYSAIRAAALLAEATIIRQQRAARKARQLKVVAEQARKRAEKILQERAAQNSQQLKSISDTARKRAEKILASKVEANRLANEARVSNIKSTTGSEPPQTEAENKQDESTAFQQIAAQLTETRVALHELAGLVGDSTSSPVVAGYEKELSKLESGEVPVEKMQTSLGEVRNRIQSAHQEARQDADALKAQLQKLAEWSEILAEDSEVQTFQNEEYAQWKQESDRLLNNPDSSKPVKELLLAAQESVARSEEVFNATTELKSKFTARNELLKNIMDSLKEVGFYVTNPSYTDEKNPESAVVIKASKGGEEMTTWVDLSEHVRSHWKESEQAGCKESFFEFVDAMKNHGVEITPDRADLQDRPQLKQKGAKDLPSSKQNQRGT